MGKLICKACNKVIHGQYYQALDANWHPECFCCAGCGQPITSQGFLTRRGKPYHPECLHEKYSPRCSGCSQPIEGEYISVRWINLAPEHLSALTVVNALAKLIWCTGANLIVQMTICVCFGKCALCGQPHDGWLYVGCAGEQVLPRHESDPRCSSCDRFIGQFHTGGGLRYADGRVICQECRSTAIDEVSDVYCYLTMCRTC